jgi:hypothetical protein
MIKVADLEARIREMAGEIAILQLREAGYKDDIARLQDELVDMATEPAPKRKGRDA